MTGSGIHRDNRLLIALPHILPGKYRRHRMTFMNTNFSP